MKCIICEKEFVKTGKHHRYKIKNKITCSRKCSIIYARVHKYLWHSIRKKLQERN